MAHNRCGVEHADFINTRPDVAVDESCKDPMPGQLIAAVDISTAIVHHLPSDEGATSQGSRFPVDAG